MAATCTNALVFIIVLFIGTLYNCNDICYFHNLRCCCILREAPASYLMLHKSRLSTSSSRSISTWHKRGHVYLCRPFFMDLTIAMDVESNPGPNWSLDELSPNNRSQTSFSSLISEITLCKFASSIHSETSCLFETRASSPQPFSSPINTARTAPRFSSLCG